MQVVIFIVLVVLALGGAAIFYTSQDRRGIRRNFSELMKAVPGTLKAYNPLKYPEAEIQHQGRKVGVAFHMHEVNRTSFLSLVYHTPVQVDSTFLLLKKDFFKPLKSEENFSRHVGERVPDLDNGYVVRAKDADQARHLLSDSRVKGNLKALDGFSNILVDAKNLVISKPYDGIKETTPERIMENVELIIQMAAAVEAAAGKTPVSKP